MSVSLVRCLLVWFVVTVAVTGLLVWMVTDLTSAGWAGRDFAALLGFTAEVCLGLCAGWFWAVTTVVTAQAAHRGADSGSRIDPLLCPPSVRRLLLAACGIALGSSLVSAPALAVTGGLGSDQRAAQGRQVSPSTSLVGLALPERAGASTRRPLAGAPASRTIRVQSGDTLWSLSKGLLPPGATDAEIVLGWQVIHHHNRAVIGADPDLILPGTELSIPDLQQVAR